MCMYEGEGPPDLTRDNAFKVPQLHQLLFEAARMWLCMDKEK